MAGYLIVFPPTLLVCTLTVILQDDLKTICDLVEDKFERSQGTPDDLNPTIALQHLASSLSKWNKHYKM